MKYVSISLTLLIVMMAATEAAVAQVDAMTALQNYERQTGVYITGPVKNQFPSSQASRFLREHGNFTSARQVADALRELNVKVVPNNRSDNVNVTIKGETFDSSSLGPQQTHYLAQLFTVASINLFLEKFATVHLTVQPVPPRNYQVKINGEDCDATDQGIYKVPPGSTAVMVSRASKPPCSWNGDIAAGKEQLVSCKL